MAGRGEQFDASHGAMVPAPAHNTPKNSQFCRTPSGMR
jgi:hypothetical protein